MCSTRNARRSGRLPPRARQVHALRGRPPGARRLDHPPVQPPGRQGVRRIRLHDVRHKADGRVMCPAVGFPLVGPRRECPRPHKPAAPVGSSRAVRYGSDRPVAVLVAASVRRRTITPSVGSATGCRGDRDGRGEIDRDAVGRVVAMLRDTGRSEETVRQLRVVLDRFADFLTGRGLAAASDEVCIDFVANQTGVRLGALRESVKHEDVRAVRRPVVLLADLLAGRPINVDRPVIAARDHCPPGFRPLRDDYLAGCRERGIGAARSRDARAGAAAADPPEPAAPCPRPTGTTGNRPDTTSWRRLSCAEDDVAEAQTPTRPAR